jgi:hypothetical protein
MNISFVMQKIGVQEKSEQLRSWTNINKAYQGFEARLKDVFPGNTGAISKARGYVTMLNSRFKCDQQGCAALTSRVAMYEELVRHC